MNAGFFLPVVCRHLTVENMGFGVFGITQPPVGKFFDRQMPNLGTGAMDLVKIPAIMLAVVFKSDGISNPAYY